MEHLENHHADLAASESAQANHLTKWDRWAAEAEKILGFSLDGDQTRDGHSMEQAHDDFCDGLTPQEYAANVKKFIENTNLYTINLAMDIRAYGYVEVRAETGEEATKKITHAFLARNFEPHGNGDDDYDYSQPTNVYLMEYSDNEGDDVVDIEIDMPNPDPSPEAKALRSLIAAARNYLELCSTKDECDAEFEAAIEAAEGVIK